MTIKQISATQLKAQLQQDPKIFLLDVREKHEYRYAHIKGSVLIPLNQLPERLDELDAQQEIVVICHHGVRSQQAAHFLVHNGFVNITNLVGGIEAWACECDKAMPRY